MNWTELSGTGLDWTRLDYSVSFKLELFSLHTRSEWVNGIFVIEISVQLQNAKLTAPSVWAIDGYWAVVRTRLQHCFLFRTVVVPQRRYPVPFAMYLYRFIAASVRVRDEQGRDGTDAHNFRNDQWYKWNSFASQTPLRLPLARFSVLMRCRKSSKPSIWTPFNVCNNKLSHIWALLLLFFLFLFLFLFL